jgi:hypothetical protein
MWPAKNDVAEGGYHDVCPEKHLRRVTLKAGKTNTDMNMTK